MSEAARGRDERAGKGGAERGEERSCRCSRRPTAAERRSCQSRLCVALTPLILFCSALPPTAIPLISVTLLVTLPASRSEIPHIKGILTLNACRRDFVYMSG